MSDPLRACLFVRLKRTLGDVAPLVAFWTVIIAYYVFVISAGTSAMNRPEMRPS